MIEKGESSYKHIAPEKNIKNKVTDFYTVCVDNFFNNPMAIRNWALSLPKKPDPCGQWPGKRSEILHQINFQFINQVILKVLSSYFDLRYTDVSWESSSAVVQEIEPFTNNNFGWIHQDSEQLAFIIYLTPEANVDAGTSLYNLKEEAKDDYFYQSNQYEKIAQYQGKDYDEKKYAETMKQHQDMFLEKVKYSNMFNRMIAYDGNEFHSANNLVTGKDPRLTLAGFLSGLKVDLTPLKRVKHNLYFDKLIESSINGT